MKMPLFAALTCASLTFTTMAQEPSPVLRDRPDMAAGEDVLGEEFTSETAGISFRSPAGMKLIRRGSADEIAQFSDENRKWSLLVSRRTLQQPTPLSGGTDAEGKRREGFAESTLAQLLIDYPRAQIVREDAMTLSDHDAALLAARVTLGTQRHLLQQGIIQANPRYYYLLTLSTPTEVPADADESAEDSQERLAVAAFMQALESVKLLDLSAVREDQDKRLLATRAFYDTLTPEKLREALIEEQWLRIQRDGRDIGYTYIVEETDKLGAKEAIVLLLRTRTMPEGKKQVDASLRVEMSGDRRHESWSAVEVVTEPSSNAIDHAQEVGSSDFTVKRKLDRGQFGAAGADPKQPPVREEETYKLKVTYSSKTTTPPPVDRELPPFYLPKGVEHLLARLLPLDKPNGYLFASYISDARQVMLRYVDVDVQQEVQLDGQRIIAIPIRERIGLEGAITTHYISPDGKYLGTINSETRLTVLPTDAEALMAKWKDADLSRPNPDAAPKPQK